PRLRVLAGTSPDTMVPITNLVNTSRSHHLESSLFEGEVVAHIKGLTDEKGRVRDSEYFEREDRKGVTWSIQVQGRFLVPYSADDILFGNTFDRPLKLPWGTSAVLKFMNYIDPTLEHDLTSSSKPWALSPLISTMPHFMHARLPLPLPVPEDDDVLESSTTFPTPYSIKDSTSQLYLALADPEDDASSSFSGSYFAQKDRRRELVFGPEDLITTDFCYGFINFAPSLSLQLPGGLSFDLMKYWDGQPVRFVCCERVTDLEAGGEVPWGRIFWCVAIEVVD
ncbi:hypothetical protein GALMADRAFT_33591, partial [Galerina marginata CBS 339.88]